MNYTMRDTKKKLEQLEKKRKSKDHRPVFITEAEAKDFDIEDLLSGKVIFIDDINKNKTVP